MIITSIEQLEEGLFKIKWEQDMPDDILNIIKEKNPDIYNNWHIFDVGEVVTSDIYHGEWLEIMDNTDDTLTLRRLMMSDLKLVLGMHLLKVKLRKEYDPTNKHCPYEI